MVIDLHKTLISKERTFQTSSFKNKKKNFRIDKGQSKKNKIMTKADTTLFQ